MASDFTEDAPDEDTRERQIQSTIRFIQMGLGARFDTDGQPIKLDSAPQAPANAHSDDEPNSEPMHLSIA